MRKRVFGAVLTAALFAGLLTGGCGSSENESKNDQEQAGAQESGAQDGMSTQTDNTAAQTAARQAVLQTFEAVTLDGDAYTQENLSEKDVTLINFWSLTCGPCIAEMPDIAAFAASLPENVQVITVCLDGAYDKEAANEILDDAGFEGVTLLSGDGDFESLCAQIMYTPTTVVVDTEGNLAGEVIIGGQEDLAKTYTDAVNDALISLGKEEIDLT